jgi:hypothetical protein
MDLSGLLLLYSSLGDAEGVSKLACLAKEQGKNNVAFLCLFTLGRLEDCLQLLVERYFITVHLAVWKNQICVFCYLYDKKLS